MNILQLNPVITLETPRGKGFTFLVIDYGMEHHLYWVVFIDKTRECWTFSNKDVRIQSNISLGRVE